MTNYHVLLESKQRDSELVAVFDYESTEKESCELPLVPFRVLAQSQRQVFANCLQVSIFCVYISKFFDEDLVSFKFAYS